jgi:peptidoglycan/xylan/chitin deacetylase (PgdA/CDA1 family)
MKNFWVGLVAAVAIVSVAAAADLSKVVVIKADDFGVPNAAWTNFLEISRAAGVKVSIGIIAESLPTSSATKEWLRAQEKAGDVEFWNHGWDHKQWTTNGQIISEFQGSGLAHQREHLARSQSKLKAALGKDVIAFGTPFNALDADTAKAINGTPELRLLFTHNLAGAKNSVTNRVALLDIISESDGTAKPNAEKFASLFEKRQPGPVSLQFHPPYFDAAHLAEYKKILAWLKAHDYQMMLPSEFIALAATNSLPEKLPPLK